MRAARRSPDGFGDFSQSVVTLINYLLFLGVWPADLVFIANANVTAAGNGTGGAADDGTFVPGDPDYWLILYSVSFAIVCMTLLTNVRPPDMTRWTSAERAGAGRGKRELCVVLHGIYRVRVRKCGRFRLDA